MIENSVAGFSSPESFNYNIEASRIKINNFIKKIIGLNNAVNRYISLYNVDYIEQLIDRVSMINNSIDNQVALSKDSIFTRSLHYDFVSQREMNYDKIIRDPKTQISSVSSPLFINPRLSSLTLKESSRQSINNPLVDASSFYGSPFNFAFDGLNWSYYVIKHDPQDEIVTLTVNFDSLKDVNTIDFDINSSKPVDIMGVKVFDVNAGSYTPLIGGTSKNNSIGKNRVVFPTFNTNSLQIQFKLKYPKVTNLIINAANNTLALLEAVASGSEISYDELPYFNNSYSADYSYFIYHFVLSNLNISHAVQNPYGIFVSRDSKTIEPSFFYVRAFENLNNISLDYYIYKYDVNNIGDKISGSENMYPILPEGKESVQGERIYFNDNAAKTSFFFDDSTVILKENDIVVNPANYTAVGNTITYAGADSLKIYTVSYTPFFKNSTTLSPVDNPEDTVNISMDVTYKPEQKIRFDGTNEYPFDSASGQPYLKILLPYLVGPDYTITRFFDDGTEDNVSPVLITSGGSQNVYLIGRNLYIPFDTDLYPKLFNCKYTITGSLVNIPYLENVDAFYAQNNALVINWENIKKRNNYSHTITNLIIIARPTNGSGPYMVQVADAYVLTNTFNDFIYDNQTLVKPLETLSEN